MTTDITLYDCEAIIAEIEAKANADSGEISEQDLALLVDAQTKSIEKLGKLVGYIKHLESFVDMAKAERERIKAREDTANNRLESIKKYLLPYVKRKGGKVQVGTNTLGIRKSSGVVVAEGFDNKMYCRHIPERWEPDLPKIKESIKAGVEVKGALLEPREKVQIR